MTEHPSVSNRITTIEVTLEGLGQKLTDHFGQEEHANSALLKALENNQKDHEAIMASIKHLAVAQAVISERLSTVSKVMWAFLGAGLAAFVAALFDLVTK